MALPRPAGQPARTCVAGATSRTATGAARQIAAREPVTNVAAARTTWVREDRVAPTESPGLAGYVYYAYNCRVRPKFDPAKNAANLRKHGVPLSAGDGVLYDPLALTVEDVTAEGERRFVTLGLNAFGMLMVVVFTYRGDDVRLIFVRNATPKERRTYEKAL